MKIFTINQGVQAGAIVETFELKNSKVKIPAIIIGEEGVGRVLGVLPVHLSPVSFAEWKENGEVYIDYATIGETKTGAPKLFQSDVYVPGEDAICVFRTKFGFRGSNRHTGDRAPHWSPSEDRFLPFPGSIICSGVVAHGRDVAMGYGEQLVAIIPVNAIFRTVMSGFRYGSPYACYFRYNGESIDCENTDRINSEGRYLADLW